MPATEMKRDDEPRRAQTPWRTEGLPDNAAKGEKKRPKLNWRRLLTTLALTYLLSFLLLSFFAPKPHSMSYTDFKAQVAAKNVAEVYAKGNTIQGKLAKAVAEPDNAEATFTEFATERPEFAQDDLLQELQEQNTKVVAEPIVGGSTLSNLIFSFLPWILIIGFYVWMMRKQSSMMGGGLLGGKRKGPVDPESIRVTFDDVAGIDEVEGEVAEIVDFLKNPGKYTALGARPPKGVLLVGPPGTGKTLLARATAGEAGVPFFSASASEFIEMIVGVGAQRVRQLFEEARKVAPAIIFIDEIDTIGRARAGGRALGGNDEREQTLNQILTEMDGFTGKEGVVVLAATNRGDVLDPALVRPGRFDRTITVNAPDAAGREQILRVHTREVPLAGDVDLTAVSKSTPGMTGADLANLVNEAALEAARKGQKDVTQANIFSALERIQLGAARHVVMPEEERRRTAYHEAGHALLGMLQPGADPVRKVSIIPRGRALGVTLSTPDADRYGYDEIYLRGRIIGALGGMAAEEVIFDVVTTGAESDLETSTGIARQMVGRWGMSDAVGPVQIYPTDADARSAGFSEEMLARADAEVRRIVEECYAQAKEQLTENRPKLDAIVAQLLEKETLDEGEVYAAAGIDRSAAPSPQDTMPGAHADGR